MSAVLKEMPVTPETIENITPHVVHKRPVNWGTWVPILTLILVFIGFSFLSEAFFTQRNLTNLSRQVSVNCILAFGMTVIILLGAIDLSIGSLLALGSVIAGLMQVNAGYNQEGIAGAFITVAAVFGVTGLVGSFTGAMIAKFRMPPFVVTLGIFVIARGLALIFAGGSKIAPLSDAYRWPGTAFVGVTLSTVLICLSAVLGTVAVFLSTTRSKVWKTVGIWAVAGSFAWVFSGYHGIPLPVLLMAGVFAIVYFFLNKTTFGRFVYAIGGNPEAARLCGIRVPLIYFVTYVMMGVLVGLSALIEGGRIDAGDPNSGNLYELDAIAAVVIGGTSLQGGIGSVFGTLLGAFLMGTLNNGMSLLNVPTNFQMVIKGVIIIVAVLIDVISKKSRK